MAKIWNEPTAAYVDIAANGIIPSLNGFMVQVLANAPASLTIPAAARVHDATPWYKEGEAAIKLLAYDRKNNTSQETVIDANNMATEGFDAALDCRFLPGYAPHFYSVAGSESLSTNTLPAIDANTVVEMGFVKNQATEFSIGLDPDHIVPGLVVYLTDLGFTEAARVENIRRVAEVARLMVDASLIVLVSFISPFRAERRFARELVAEGEFCEVFVDTPLDVAEGRDRKGLYKKARRGELKNFTGIDSPYENPEHAEVTIDTVARSAEDAADQIIAHLRESGVLDPA